MLIGRAKRNKTAIVWLNILAGWTAIGWLVALIWALMDDDGQPREPAPASDVRGSSTARAGAWLGRLLRRDVAVPALAIFAALMFIGAGVEWWQQHRSAADPAGRAAVAQESFDYVRLAADSPAGGTLQVDCVGGRLQASVQGLQALPPRSRRLLSRASSLW